MGRENPDSRCFGSPPTDAEILATARHNVVTYSELRELGLSSSAIDRRTCVGRLHRKYSEVFAVGRPDLTLDGTFLAAVLACGPDAKLSHRSALRKWGLRGGGTYKVDVTAPRSIRKKDGIRLHRPLSLDALDTTIIDGIPITSVAQTLLDAAAPLDEATLALFRSYSLPEPEMNEWVWDGAKLVEVDCLWRRFGLIVEVDGGRYHSTRWRRRQDAAKTAAQTVLAAMSGLQERR